MFRWNNVKELSNRYSSRPKALDSLELPAVSCNGQLLKQCRGFCGWTQAELAMRSGLSRKLIAKAEGRNSIDPQAIEILAHTLRKGGAAVTIADLSTDPVSLVRRFLKTYATHHADCVQHCLDFISPDIVAFVDGDSATNPIAGEYRGIDEFDGMFRKLFSIFVRSTFVRSGGTLGEYPKTKCIGKEVLAWGNEYIYVRGGSMPAKFPWFVLLRIWFEDGKMIRFEVYYIDS